MSIRRTDAPSQRTDEERERAREERERRRLERQGRRLAPAPVEESVPRDELPAEPPAAEVAEPPAAQPEEPSLDELPAAEAGDLQVALPEEALRDELLAAEAGDLQVALPEEPSLDELPAAEAEDPPTAQPAEPGPIRRHRPRVHRPHLHRPHVHKPHSRRARLGAVAALAAVVAVLGVGAFALERAVRHKAPAAPLAVTRIVVPEGSTGAQIAAIARSHGLRGDYLRAAGASNQLKPSHYGASPHEHSLEGFLFPATYELYAGAPVTQLVSKQLTAFEESFSSADAARARALGITSYQLLIVASMVEREAVLARERPLVAAVVYNRLHRNMPLGIDATIRYALHDYTHPLTEAQLHSSSPYNTRTHTGLPPTPISNPGLASIEAAANPARVQYLYYVARADGCPGQVFSSTYSQFERDAAAYRAALDANHGNVPRCTHR